MIYGVLCPPHCLLLSMINIFCQVICPFVRGHGDRVGWEGRGMGYFVVHACKLGVMVILRDK